MQRIITWIGLAATLGACAPATVQMARTNGAGNFQFGIEPGFVGFAGGGTGGFIPAFNVAGRYGVTDQLDIGARLGSSLYELQFKYMFTDVSMDEMAISLAPSTTFFGAGAGGASGFFWDTRVPLLLGLPVGNGSEFTFGPSARLFVVGAGGGGTGGAGLGMLLGGQVGYAAKVANNFRIVPQFDLSAPVVGAAAAGGESGIGIGGGGLLWGVQLGFLIGGPQ